jgi:hypothetical protein
LERGEWARRLYEAPGLAVRRAQRRACPLPGCGPGSDEVQLDVAL